MRTLRFGSFLAALALVACSNNQNAIVPPSFDRASGVAVGCYRVDGDVGTFLALGECRGFDNQENDDVDSKRRDPIRHIALVVQTARGEIGAVDLQEREAIDSNLRVPGYTFQRVGELPVAVVLPPDSPYMAFVANFGSSTVQSLDTLALVPGTQPYLVGESPITVTPAELPLPSGPSDLAYFETGTSRFLFAPLPETGEIVQISVSPTGALTSVTPLPVDTTVPPLMAIAPGPGDVMRLCPTDFSQRVAVPSVRTPTALGVDPTPVRARVVDGPAGKELLVADATLPMIHRYTLDTAGATAATNIATGTPTLDFAVTPLVPSALGAPRTERYVYAIDATNRSVMAIDYNASAVVAVGVGSDVSDRIPLRVDARTLEVGTPEYPLLEDEIYCSSTDELERREDASPSTLRGVFLFVAAVDGTFHTVDVYDLDAECRGGVSCADPPLENDVYVHIRRHHPRMAELADEGPSVEVPPSTLLGSRSARISSDGSAIGSDTLGLLTVTCDGTDGPLSEQLYPEGDAEALICGTPDPWLGRNQRWLATYEGQLPNAAGILGRLADNFLGNPGTFLVAPGYDFCAVGTIGGQDVVDSALAMDDPEAGYVGDLLVLTGDMPQSTLSDPACAKFRFPERDDEVRDRIAFPIEQAVPGALRIGEAIGGEDTVVTSFAEVASCFPEPTSWAIHAQGAFVVQAALTEPTHRVADVAGACRIDTTGFVLGDFDTYRGFRAFPGRLFATPEVSFRIASPGSLLASGVRSRVTFDVTNVPRTLGTVVGSLVESMVFDATNDLLYVVDSGRTGLSVYELTPIEKSFSVF